MKCQSSEQTLKRGLKNRHIQLIALGGAIGTGLFLGVAETIKLAGPSVLLGYAIAGLIAFFIMRQLGEMVVEEPVAGSFSHFANKYWGGFPGFVSGWNYWVLYVLVSMSELTAVGLYIQFWWPGIPAWISALCFFALINAVNLLHVKLYGELEFWFAIVKVLAIVSMIIFGGYLLFGTHADAQSSVDNLWKLGGFFPHGISGLVMAMAFIMFSFGGLELVGITAAEADDPKTTIPRATNQVIYRILIFYVGSLAVLLSLFPWDKVGSGGSPFVMIFAALHVPYVPTILNVVVLTAALSVYNSSVYCNSRMLLGLALQGNAPVSLARMNRRGVPVNALLTSGVATVFGVLLNYLMPASAFGILMALVVSALVINWAMITVTHYKFREAMRAQKVVTGYRSLGYPVTNLVCLLFMLGILVIMAITPGTRVSVVLIPVWLLLLAGMYAYRKRTSLKTSIISPEAESV